MNEEKVYKKIKEIKRKVKWTKSVFVIAVILLLLFVPVHFSVRALIAVLFLLAEMIIITKIKNASVNILYNECDPQSFYAVCHGIFPQGTTSFYDAEVSYFIGDFQSVARNVSATLNGKLNMVSKFQYLNLLTSAAFCCGDFALCNEMSIRAKTLLSELRINEKAKKGYLNRYDFFSSFINEKYDDARNFLDKCKSANESKQLNSYKLMMCYYTALTLYYSGETQQAKKAFENIITAAPEFFILERAKAYVSAVDNNVFLPYESVSLKNSFEEGKHQAPPEGKTNKKRQISTVLLLVLLLVIIIICLSNIPGMERGSAYDVIRSEMDIREICASTAVDDNYTIFIFTTEYDEIGIAYLKNQGKLIYSYCMSNAFPPEAYLEDDEGYYIKASGNTEKVYFDITNDKSYIPENSNVTDFEYNGKTYYFYIFNTEKAYSFFNSFGTN